MKRALRAAAVGGCLCIAVALLVLPVGSARTADESIAGRDRRLIQATAAAMPAQRPGRPDLYVVGFAGDGYEDVFRNEVRYLETLASARLGAERRVVSLINHPDSLEDAPQPLATLDNLRLALAGIGQAMNREEDLLLLFVTSHGTEEHELVVALEPMVDDVVRPDDLRTALDEAGIRNRVLVISACFSGGFLPALEGPDTLVITAAREDRTSFGCGVESSITYFGNAWLVEGLNRHTSFIGAYDEATRRIARRERKDGYEPSLPQIAVGARVGRRLQAWQALLPPTAPVPYPYPPDF
ncbi:C13 family peptidase [Luteimonas suaedae]|uniref:C13 family peptidase n=1 Tax=Luteimonas suaedae TaxID=2605430 RepID=UPI0011F04AC2|nr:C13 family peptidase [Luteimonas suaedae]